MMPLSVLDTASTSATRTSSGVSVSRQVDKIPSAPVAMSSPQQADLPVREGAHLWANRPINQRAAGVQQTLAFIGRAQSDLNVLKQGLGNALAAQVPATDALQTRLRQFDTLWQSRAQATAGSLDGALAVVDTGQAQLAFRARGLSTQDVRLIGSETLQFSVQGRQSSPVLLGNMMSAADSARQLNRALAPLGVQIGVNDKSELLFSVNELGSQSIRAALMIKGEGRRFPSGLYNKLHTDAVPEAIQPHNWSIANPLAIRKTLQEVIQASAMLYDAQNQATDRLNVLERESALPADFADGAAESMVDFAQGFKVLASRPAYDATSLIAPAVSGLTPARVNAVLRLR